MSKFISFSTNVSKISLPKKIAYPYNYTPHKIAKIAAKELQEYLKNNTDFASYFNLKNSSVVGKMFGVLVVKDSNNNIGYLASFSGKLAKKNTHKHFVLPVFDILTKNGFYKKTEKELNIINSKITDILKSKEYLLAKNSFKKQQEENNLLLKKEQLKIKERRKQRKLNNKIDNQQNINEEFYLREYEFYLNKKRNALQIQFTVFEYNIDNLKKLRKEKSAWLQQEVFRNYQFLNSKQESKNLVEIFKNYKQNIPAGAGECCAPKLFQHAFLNKLTPIALAEFWWGNPLKTSIKKHGNYYTPCTGKCKPILTHMLQGLCVAKNPLEKELKKDKKIEIIFEDDFLAVVNKPTQMLSVPGKKITDSVYYRVKKLFPKATGPLLIHRLDMATSGILLIAKDKETYKLLQKQFSSKIVKKRYVALLDGVLPLKKGTINLPLRVDLDDRPKQLVCYTHGKKATTNWKVIAIKNNKTKVYLYPITGKTHQLRIHCAHFLGLHVPIVGDILYGKKANRLHLHAESIGFYHPSTKQWLDFFIEADF